MIATHLNNNADRLIVFGFLLFSLLVSVTTSALDLSDVPDIEGVERLYNDAGELVGIQITNNKTALRKVDAIEIDQRLNDDDPTNDNFHLMVRGFGTFMDYQEFMRTAKPGEITALHLGYGIEPQFTVQQGDIVGRDISGEAHTNVAPKGPHHPYRDPRTGFNCPAIWPEWGLDGHRNWNAVDWVGNPFIGQNFRLSVDSIGRTGKGYIVLTPRGRGLPMSRACKTVIRSTGRSGDDAGHVIAKALGGGPYRANFMAQSRELNRGIWASSIERTARKCAQKISIFGNYSAQPLYDLGGARPSRLRARMHAWKITDTDTFRLQLSDFVNRAPDQETRNLATVWRNQFDICQ